MTASRKLTSVWGPAFNSLLGLSLVREGCSPWRGSVTSVRAVGLRRRKSTCSLRSGFTSFFFFSFFFCFGSAISLEAAKCRSATFLSPGCKRNIRERLKSKTLNTLYGHGSGQVRSGALCPWAAPSVVPPLSLSGDGSRALFAFWRVVGLRCQPRHVRLSRVAMEPGRRGQPRRKGPLAALHQAVGVCNRCPEPSWARMHKPSCHRFVPSAAGAFWCIKPTQNDNGKVLLLAKGWEKENTNLLWKDESGTSPSRAKLRRLLRHGVWQTVV